MTLPVVSPDTNVPPFEPETDYELRVTRPLSIAPDDGPAEDMSPGVTYSKPGAIWNDIVSLHGMVALQEPPEGDEPPALVAMPLDGPKVDRERDRRISAGFAFAGKMYQSRQTDRENIAGAATAALAAVMNGALVGDLRWHGGASDFAWIAADNTLVPMDAQTVFAFGQAAMAHKQAQIFAARALKDAQPIPADYADDGHWPAVAAP